MLTINQYLANEEKWEQRMKEAERAVAEAQRTCDAIRAQRPNRQNDFFIPFCEEVAKKCQDIGVFDAPKILYYEQEGTTYTASIHDEKDPHGFRSVMVKMDFPWTEWDKRDIALIKDTRTGWGWIRKAISNNQPLDSREVLQFILHGAYELGDKVRVLSATSQHRGEFGVIRDACNGKYSDFVQVELESGERVNLALSSLVVFR